MQTIWVLVKPHARLSTLERPGADGLWNAQLKAPPVEGRANAELVALIARHFGCPKARVSIKRGSAGRIKQVQIDWD